MARPLRIAYDYGTVDFTCRGDKKNGILNITDIGRNFLNTLQESIKKCKMELSDYDIGISHLVRPIREEDASCGWQ
ncbi:MAG: hypothetical protein HS132_15385 [Planctomycetia bacterium]|nr:hypothetical protein [Planctomycetia bacterium]